MSKSISKEKKWHVALFLRYSRKTGKCVCPVTLSFHSSSTTPRNLNDIASRFARENGIEWDRLIVRDSWGKTLSQRYRLGYRSLIK